MAELQRITTEFVDAEDRIRLAGEDAAGEAVVLWLTQRLLNRLVAHLCNWLEQRIPADIHHYAAAAQAEVIQSFAQQAALAALEPQTPVQSKVQSRTWLVHSVDITSGDQGVMLTFKAPEVSSPSATLTLHDQPLRQWLNILHDQYQKAEWPLSVWPEWMAAPPLSPHHGTPSSCTEAGVAKVLFTNDPTHTLT